MKEPIEQKYIFPLIQKDMVLDFLKFSLIEDPKFPFGSIVSLYYDTFDFVCYQEKRNSDYLKSKLRLRFYKKIEELDPESKIACYLELKKKCGSIRSKSRIELSVDAKSLLNDPFSDRKIQAIPAEIFKLDNFTKDTFFPMLFIQYDRYRFIDPRSNSRIALDINISCPRINTRFIPALAPVNLDMGVLEIKGDGRDLVDSLNPIRFHLHKEAFSKYGVCYEKLMQPLGRSI